MIPSSFVLGGFPHSDICESMAICASPQLFAAYHVLLRLLVPRHSPYALSSLTFKHFGLRLLLFFLGFLSGVSISSYPFGHFTFAYYFINICFAYIIQFSRYIPENSYQLFWSLFSGMVEIMRFELMTPCLQGRCSPS